MLCNGASLTVHLDPPAIAYSTDKK